MFLYPHSNPQHQLSTAYRVDDGDEAPKLWAKVLQQLQQVVETIDTGNSNVMSSRETSSSRTVPVDVAAVTANLDRLAALSTLPRATHKKLVQEMKVKRENVWFRQFGAASQCASA